jgi:hypothetical protein
VASPRSCHGSASWASPRGPSTSNNVR